MANYPKQLKSTGIKSLMDRAIRTQKLDIIRNRTGSKNKREWKALHGFRKYFNTTLANAKVDPLCKEILMGHDIGLDKSYLRPNENTLLEEYLKAVNDLTINEEFRLKQKLKKLTDNQDEISNMRTKHNREIKRLEQQIVNIREELANIVTAKMNKNK